MHASAFAVYLGCVVLLFAKYVLAITVQARERLRLRHFRYAEDAAFWNGTVAEDSALCQRAQNLLRNDGENQPFFLVFGAAHVSLGLSPASGLVYFAGYALCRFAHGYFMLRARQPHRNRAFAAGSLILAILAAHVMVAAIVRSLN